MKDKDQPIIRKILLDVAAVAGIIAGMAVGCLLITLCR